VYQLRYFNEYEKKWVWSHDGSHLFCSNVFQNRYLIVSCQNSTTMDLWDLDQHNTITHSYLRKGHSQAFCALVGADYGYLVAVCREGVFLYDRYSQDCVFAWTAGYEKHRVLRFHPTNPNLFATGVHQHDQELYVWKVRPPRKSLLRLALEWFK
jgi:WD40 repeat protein